MVNDSVMNLASARAEFEILSTDPREARMTRTRVCSPIVNFRHFILLVTSDAQSRFSPFLLRSSSHVRASAAIKTA